MLFERNKQKRRDSSLCSERCRLGVFVGKQQTEEFYNFFQTNRTYTQRGLGDE